MISSNRNKYLASLINRIIKEISECNTYEVAVLFKKILEVYSEGNVQNEKITEVIQLILVMYNSENEPSPFHPPYEIHNYIIDIGYFIPGDTVELYLACFHIINKRLHLKLMTLLHEKEEFWKLHIDQFLVAILSYPVDEDFDILEMRENMLKKILQFDGGFKLLQSIANGSVNIIKNAAILFDTYYIQNRDTKYFEFGKSMSIKDLITNIDTVIKISNVDYHIIQENALVTHKNQSFYKVAMYASNRCSVCRKIIWGFTAYSSKRDLFHLNCIYNNSARMNDDDQESFGRIYDKLLDPNQDHHENESVLIVDLLVLQYILLHRSGEYPDLKYRLVKGIDLHKGLGTSTKKLFFSDINVIYPLYHVFSRKYFDQASVPATKMMGFYKDIARKVIQQHIIDLNILHGLFELQNDSISLHVPVFHVDSAYDILLLNCIEKLLSVKDKNCYSLAWWIIKLRVHPVAFKDDNTLFQRLFKVLTKWYSKLESDSEYWHFMDKFHQFIMFYRPVYSDIVDTEIQKLPQAVTKHEGLSRSSHLSLIIYKLQTDQEFDAKYFFRAVKNPRIPFIFGLDEYGKKLLGELLQSINKDKKLVLKLNAMLFKYRINVSVTWLNLMTKLIDIEDAPILGQLVLLNFRVASDIPINRVKGILEWLKDAKVKDDKEFQIMYFKIFATLLGCSTETTKFLFQTSKLRRQPYISLEMGYQYIKSFLEIQTKVCGLALMLFTRMVEAYHHEEQFLEMTSKLMNLFWSNLDYDDLRCNYSFCRCIEYILRHVGIKTKFLNDSLTVKNPIQFLKNINWKIQYYLNYYFYVVPVESIDFTFIICLCLQYIGKGLLHEDPIVRHAAKVFLESKIHFYEWHRSKKLDTVFTNTPPKVHLPFLNAIVTIQEAYPVFQFFSITKLLDSLGKASFDYFNEKESKSKEVQAKYINTLFRIVFNQLASGSTLSQPEMVVVKYLVTVHLGFSKVKIEGMGISIGTFSSANLSKNQISFADVVLKCCRKILDQQADINSDLRNLQIDLSNTMFQCFSKSLFSLKEVGHLHFKNWLELIHFGIFYNYKSIDDHILKQIFVDLIKIANQDISLENKEFCLLLIQKLGEQDNNFYSNKYDEVVKMCGGFIKRLKENPKDNLGKRAAVALFSVLQCEKIKGNFYNYLSCDNEMISYLQIINDTEARETRLVDADMSLNTALDWDALRIQFFERLLFYGVDSLEDVKENFAHFLNICKDYHISQQSAMTITRILDDIMKKTTNTIIKDSCAGYFLLSISVLLEKHGYLSTSVLDNLRFNLDSFLCNFKVADQNTVIFFDKIKDKDLDLFEFTMSTVFKSKLNKSMANRAFSPLFLKYLDDQLDFVGTTLDFEEIIDNALGSGNSKDYLEIASIVSKITMMQAPEFNVEKLSKSRILKAYIVMIFAGFSSNSFAITKKLLIEHQYLSDILIEGVKEPKSNLQQTSRQTLVLQIFCLLKLNSFVSRYVLETSDEHFNDTITKFDFAIWNALFQHIKLALVSNDASNLLHSSCLDFLEFLWRTFARVDSVILNGLLEILDQVNLSNPLNSKYTEFKRIYNTDSVITPKIPSELYKILETEITHLD
eukprot:NODE_2_length_91304_cov_0.692462.p2 type:complete len:1587 gc:universal NODE_2_length_91304_cov_0.692462:16337-11577(-)